MGSACLIRMQSVKWLKVAHGGNIVMRTFHGRVDCLWYCGQRESYRYGESLRMWNDDWEHVESMLKFDFYISSDFKSKAGQVDTDTLTICKSGKSIF